MITKAVNIVAQLSAQKEAIEHWFEAQWSTLTPVFYASVDLRYSGFKLAPVDVNLYPAGFNNLAPSDAAYAAIAVKQLLHRMQNNYQRVLIITENHTRNVHYLENVATLKNILTQAGLIVKLSKLPSTKDTITLHSGQSLSFDSVFKQNDYLHIHNFIPDCIILNNDLSEAPPDLLSGIRQPILPSPNLGWHQRKKSHYFSKYNEVCQTFSTAFSLDEWLINPLFKVEDKINFKDSTQQATLMETAHAVLTKLHEKYQSYQLDNTPYLVIKANSGSYGMGVITLDNINLSRKQRQHMSKTKGNRPIQSVIVQEGIPTIIRLDESVAEPTIYLVGSKVVGGFYRMHSNRNAKENLNTPGMQLIPMTFHETSQSHSPEYYAYQVIARLAALAAAWEMRELS